LTVNKAVPLFTAVPGTTRLLICSFDVRIWGAATEVCVITIQGPDVAASGPLLFAGPTLLCRSCLRLFTSEFDDFHDETDESDQEGRYRKNQSCYCLYCNIYHHPFTPKLGAT
jgi:hypothetical protein